VIPLLAQFLKAAGVLRLVMDSPERDVAPRHLTPEEARIVSSFEPRNFAEATKELDYESLLQERAAGGLGDRPLIVLTAGVPPDTDNPIDARRVRARQRE
jgi:hypothetical protein